MNQPGPLYDPKSSVLHFVDIAEHKACHHVISRITTVFSPSFQVFHLNTNNFNLDVETFDEPVSCLVLRRNGKGVRSSYIPALPRLSLQPLVGLCSCPRFRFARGQFYLEVH